MKSFDCLIIVDLQNDFCPGGALAVSGGAMIIEPINRIMKFFPWIVTTQDWHPRNHCSFTEQGGPWPPHCIKNTVGANFHPHLEQKRVSLKVLKGTFPDSEAYSGFQQTSLAVELKRRGIKRVFIAGLATDYCVKQTALDALENGFQVTLFSDLVRGVNAHSEDDQRALQEVREKGGLVTSSQNWNWSSKI